MKTALLWALKWLGAVLSFHLGKVSKKICTIYYKHCTALNNK